MPLEAAREIIDGKALVKLKGSIDTTTATAFENALKEAWSYTPNIELDFKEVTYISSAGLRVLLMMTKKLSESGSLTILSPCASVQEVFDITGFATILNIKE